MNLSPRFEHALQYAVVVHAGQVRKGTEVPYVAHLLGVASIALEYGANEDEAIGALLHDAAEDAGGRGRLEDIRQRFGEAVAGPVCGSVPGRPCDATPRPQPQLPPSASFLPHRSAASVAPVPKGGNFLGEDRRWPNADIVCNSPID